MGTLAIIRAFNEQQTVADVVCEVRHHLPGASLLVVDDGSTDLTAERAAATGARVLSLGRNTGMGGAAQAGYRVARDEGFDVAVQVDGDGQHPGAAAAAVVEGLRGHDICVGSRFLDEEGHLSSFGRRTATRVASRWVSRAVDQPLSDVTSGLRACGPRAIALFAARYPCDYVEVESLLLAGRRGLRVAEVPVAMRPRQAGRSSIGSAQSVVYGARTVIGVAMALSTRRPAGQAA